MFRMHVAREKHDVEVQPSLFVQHVCAAVLILGAVDGGAHAQRLTLRQRRGQEGRARHDEPPSSPTSTLVRWA
eukprot:2693441-Pyramimonas_sp.AAC.1